MRRRGTRAETPGCARRRAAPATGPGAAAHVAPATISAAAIVCSRPAVPGPSPAPSLAPHRASEADFGSPDGTDLRAWATHPPPARGPSPDATAKERGLRPNGRSSPRGEGRRAGAVRAVPSTDDLRRAKPSNHTPLPSMRPLPSEQPDLLRRPRSRLRGNPRTKRHAPHPARRPCIPMRLRRSEGLRPTGGSRLKCEGRRAGAVVAPASATVLRRARVSSHAPLPRKHPLPYAQPPTNFAAPDPAFATSRRPGVMPPIQRDALAPRCDYEGARAWAQREVLAARRGPTGGSRSRPFPQELPYTACISSAAASSSSVARSQAGRSDRRAQ